MAQTIIEFLAESAERFGERPAVLFKPGIRYQQWSYADLWESAGKVATLLGQRGLRKGDRAMLWGPNCPQWVISFFGCIRAGVIAVPLDLRSPDDFVEKVVSRSRPSLAFVSPFWRDLWELTAFGRFFIGGLKVVKCNSRNQDVSCGG